MGRHDLNIYKNPSTAAGTYVQGFGGPQGGVSGQPGGGYHGGLRSGGGIGKFPNESFDLDIMMPPDIASIDSDISKKCFHPHIINYIDKLSAMTPAPLNTGNSYSGGPGGWGNHMGGFGGDFSGAKSNYPMYGGAPGGGFSHFEADHQSLYDSKYSPSYHHNNYGGATGNGNNFGRELSSQQQMIYGAK